LRIDPVEAKRIEDEMYEANVKAHRILPSEHKRTHATSEDERLSSAQPAP
jgi:hypothetical protein